ncbi:MAG: outer membrane beta-barrel protein [Henriciella sp.]
MQALKLLLPVTLFSALPVGLDASAQDFYVEGNAGAATLGGRFVGDESYDTNIAGVRAGLNINSYFAIEGEYFFGLNDHSQSFAFIAPGTGESFTGTDEYGLNSIEGIYGKISVPAGPKLDVFARLGYVTLDRDALGNVLGSEGTEWSYDNSDSDPGAAFGIGFTYDLDDRFYLRLDATRYSAFQDDADSLTLGAGVKF